MSKRVSVSTSAYYWAVTVTPDNRKPVTGFFSNRRGVPGTPGTPGWFIRGVRELSNAREFPCLHLAIDATADMVEHTAIAVASGHRVDWSMVEEWLADIRTVARGDWERR